MLLWSDLQIRDIVASSDKFKDQRQFGLLQRCADSIHVQSSESRVPQVAFKAIKTLTAGTLDRGFKVTREAPESLKNGQVTAGHCKGAFSLLR